jgi:hypothetical protein
VGLLEHQHRLCTFGDVSTGQGYGLFADVGEPQHYLPVPTRLSSFRYLGIRISRLSIDGHWDDGDISVGEYISELYWGTDYARKCHPVLLERSASASARALEETRVRM